MNRKGTGAACWLLLAAGALLTACGGGVTKDKELVHSVMLVETADVSAEGEKSFAGVIEEGREVNVGFKVGGQLAQVAVKEGQYVKQGQLIASLDDKDYRLQMEATQIQYDQTKREVERLKLLYQKGSLSGNDYDKAASGLKQLAVSLQGYKNQLSYARLYAPTSGYVSKVNYERAEMVDAGMPIVTLMDVGQMEVSVNIPASLYMQRDRMGSFACSGAFSEGKDVPLKLLSITPKADSNQLYKMRLGISAAGVKAVSGQNVEVKINMLPADGKDSQITLPLAAVFRHEGKDCVWVFAAKDSTVHRREVALGGLDSSGKAVVKSGLQGGEQVVKAGANVLQEGEKVKVVGRPSATNVGGVI